MTNKNGAFNSLKTLTVGNKTYRYYDLNAASQNGLGDIKRLPNSLKVLLENLIRAEAKGEGDRAEPEAVAKWLNDKGAAGTEISFRPARVLMQDFTGVPAVVDLAAMRDATAKLGADPEKVNPLVPVDLVIDHSVTVDHAGAGDSFSKNVALEYERNIERYRFLRWGQQAFRNFRVVPPGTGICHQVNLEYLAATVWTAEENGETFAYPDTLVGTDSHTTMINGLSVLGWGVGGIEAEAAMLGQPVSMVIPEVIGFQLTGKIREGVTATDLVLTVTQMLRAKGVVGKFVEFFGEGLDALSLEDRATIANMAPEYGATCGFFPIDKETIHYLRATGRPEDRIALVEAYAKAQGLWRDPAVDMIFTDTLSLDMDSVEPSIAGPKRPQDRVLLKNAAQEFDIALDKIFKKSVSDESVAIELKGEKVTIAHGDVAIAAITSCTNTSNPYVMIAAGLVAKKALEKGLKISPKVKTSLSPGSQVVTDYLKNAGLQSWLDQAGFTLTGYGCMTCIGNSGPLADEIAAAVTEKDLTVCSVLSGNRNFEGRVNPHVKANYLASPPLVVAYAFAGTVRKNLVTEPIGQDQNGEPVFLKDIWPTNAEVAETVRACITPDLFKKRYADVFKGDENWQSVPGGAGKTFMWQDDSTYIQNPPFFEEMSANANGVSPIKSASVLAIFGDSVTTDHISPAGSIKATAPAGKYLSENNVTRADFNSYGARRGNHEVMMRGTFANIRIKNEFLGGEEGGETLYFPNNGERMSIYDAAMKYQANNIPLVVVAGKEYGTGSSRDWAAKGTALLGVKVVIAESFERIHRSNLIGMGTLPMVFTNGQTRADLRLTGEEKLTFNGVDENLQPGAKISLEVLRKDGKTDRFELICRIDTASELDYYRNGGIMPYVLRRLTNVAAPLVEQNKKQAS